MNVKNLRSSQVTSKREGSLYLASSSPIEIENELAKEVWNLNEGIDGWSISIDSSIPRY